MRADLRCARCDVDLDPTRYARCDVCRGARYCLTCAKGHLCTTRCQTNGCIAGLCVHVVRDGVVDERFGVHEGEQEEIERERRAIHSRGANSTSGVEAARRRPPKAGRAEREEYE